KKLFNFVFPNATLDFAILGKIGETIPYDLAAVVIHQGTTIESGHYYCYFRKEIEGELKFYKYDDLVGLEECESEEEIIADMATNGYIVYYKKRVHGQLPPPQLPFEEEYESSKNTAKREREADSDSTRT